MRGVKMATEPTPRPGRGIGKWIALFVTLLTVIVASVVGFRPLAYSQGWLLPNATSTVDLVALAPSSQLFQDTGVRATPPNGSVLSARLAAVPRLTGTQVGALVLDSAGQELSSDGADSALIPASSMKLLTTVAALSVLSADTTFTTKTVLVGTDQVILVGGGDPSLTAETGGAPSTRELAEATAQRLIALGITEVSVGFDDSLFVGPSWHETWLADDYPYVGPVTALSVDAGYLSATERFSPTPSADAAQIFANQLAEAGIQVTSQLGFAQAQSDVEPLATVNSDSLLTMASLAMEHSLNVQTEILLRQLAIATGLEASFAGGTTALTSTLTALGLDTTASRFVDGSGMSAENRVTPRLLANTMLVVANDPTLSRLIPGMAVAGATGTLADRFTDEVAWAARGFVTAKTGTLDQVAALTGLTQTTDGAIVIFSIVVNGGDGDRRQFIDHWVSVITSCGCG